MGTDLPDRTLCAVSALCFMLIGLSAPGQVGIRDFFSIKPGYPGDFHKPSFLSGLRVWSGQLLAMSVRRLLLTLLLLSSKRTESYGDFSCFSWASLCQTSHGCGVMECCLHVRLFLPERLDPLPSRDGAWGSRSDFSLGSLTFEYC